mmetsp:Transcript_25142/g.59747  ORF Transcript_25142/g.59747 Transcript_25142/m.59747 type:complete len:509 (+) Transcript_25142:321-1847(+)|eukprot:CAMPEP_0113497992 /NCGR_PEP_ID=MMETSP0014_2-20120614/30915_1 /TAXON_ID=2857 /ORGANISM="Nitzschia sp." /LENGTH=508 /DNA_ID=CAMNT_0000391947 /DNA_START=210 /DNA_END=1736 /DNA_ORIENTATION=+ /assembly_acc=CAM_ASM_000159
MPAKSRARSPVPPSRQNKEKKFLDDDAEKKESTATEEDTSHGADEETDDDLLKETLPPTKRDVARVLSKLVGTTATTTTSATTTTTGGVAPENINREEQIKALDTLASWSIKSDYQVRTIGYLKLYAAIPLLLDYIEDQAGIVVDEEEEKKKLEADAAQASADKTGKAPDAPAENKRTPYDSHLVKKAAHVLAEMTYAGGKKAPPARAQAAEDMALLIIEHDGIGVMLKAVEAGIESVAPPPTEPESDADMAAAAAAAAAVEANGDPPEGGAPASDASAATDTTKLPLPSSVSSLWSALWNINSKDAVHNNMPNDTKIMLYKDAIATFETLGDDELDQRIAANIFKILRHLMPPCSDFDDDAIQAIKSQFALNRIIDSARNRDSESWLKNEALMKSFVQWMYRYLQLPGMTDEEVVPRTVWDQRVVPVLAKAMDLHPTQKDIHWCGVRILNVAVNTVGVTKETMNETGAFSSVAVTVETNIVDPSTKKKAEALLTQLMEEATLEDSSK